MDYGSTGAGLLGGGLGLILILFLIVLAILWICVPFIIMGSNQRLDGINHRLDKLGSVLNDIADNMKRSVELQEQAAKRAATPDTIPVRNAPPR